MNLGTIEEEAAACRKAFEGVAVGRWVAHCHHGIAYEQLKYSAEERISYIRSNKPEHEQALRLRLFRPATPEAGEAYEAKLKLLDDDYDAKRRLLDDDYDAKHRPLDADYWAKRKLLVDDYRAKTKLLYDDYRAKSKPLVDDYGAKRKLLDDDYDAKLRLIPHQCGEPNCPWNGLTIFPNA